MAHVDEEAALSQCTRSIAGGRSRLLRHEVIGAPVSTELMNCIKKHIGTIKNAKALGRQRDLPDVSQDQQ